jgi:hypothetical protein
VTESTILNYLPEREDKEFLTALPEAPMKTSAWASFSRPDDVDVKWHRTENQGQLGSCQGHGLTSVLERLAHVAGKSIQLSEIFAYLATQRIDGLLGRDQGSTISGGAKLAIQYGCPLESATGYPARYPDSRERDRILSKANYEAAASYKAKSIWRVPRDHEATLDFIGGGGGITFGISWYSGLIPRDRIVRKFSPGRNNGGHAMAVLGYNRDGMLRAANSHADGEFLITEQAWDQMLSHTNTTAIGLMGNAEATPVDWYSNSPYFK